MFKVEKEVCEMMFFVGEVPLPVPQQPAPRLLDFWLLPSFADFLAEVTRPRDGEPDEERKKRKRDSEQILAARNAVLSRAWTVIANRCRFVGCSAGHRASRQTLNPKKTRRGQRLFCKAHAGLRNQISKAAFQQLKSEGTLGVFRA